MTVPHKDAALALADSASEAAREIGAANTLGFGGDERIRGREHRRRRPARRAAALAARASGRWCSAPAAPPGRRSGRWLGRAPRSRSGTAPPERRRGDQRRARRRAPVGRTATRPSYELIVNTTAVGLHGEDPFDHLPLAASGFAPDQAVVDMVYSERPSRCSPPPRPARATVDGLEVLVQQGALSLQLWTGRKAPLEVMRAAARG